LPSIHISSHRQALSLFALIGTSKQLRHLSAFFHLGWSEDVGEGYFSIVIATVAWLFNDIAHHAHIYIHPVYCYIENTSRLLLSSRKPPTTALDPANDVATTSYSWTRRAQRMCFKEQQPLTSRHYAKYMCLPIRADLHIRGFRMASMGHAQSWHVKVVQTKSGSAAHTFHTVADQRRSHS